MKYAWLTDPHLDFLPVSAVSAFAKNLAQAQVDGLFITGDITVAPSLTATLTALDKTLPFPIYAVLGNHDYYGSSIAKTRSAVRAWSKASPKSRWMPEAGVVSLSPNTALIGHGGWGDGQLGDFMGSRIMLNDYVKIEELQGHAKADLLNKLRELGEEAADFLEIQLKNALNSHPKVILLTHVPPFLEASWHEGQIELGEWTPHFTCGAVGERITNIMLAHPEHDLQVLCGHTHGAGEVEMLPNLRVSTGGAVYREPKLQAPITVM